MSIMGMTMHMVTVATIIIVNGTRGTGGTTTAYLHVLADALTSVLAILALLLGRINGWLWADPLMGMVGAAVIARWSWGLIREAGGVLLDIVPEVESLPDEIRAIVERDGDRITDLHVWRVGPGHHSAIVALVAEKPKAPSYYKSKLAHIHELSHVTIEVEKAAAAWASSSSY